MSENEQEVPKKKSKLKWIILIIVLLLIVGGGAAFWFLLGDKLLGGGEEGAEGDAPAETKTVQAQLPPQQGILVNLDPFTVNLSDPLGKRFMKAAFQVELPNEIAVADMTARMPKIRDSIILLLSSKTYADVATMESKYQLKSEIADRINQILPDHRVMAVYITDMIIQ